MRGLTGAAARELRVTLQPSDGVRIAQVFGYAAETSAKQTDITVGTLRAGQHRDILLRLQFDALKGPSVPILRTTVRFKNMLAEEAEETLHADLNLKIVADEAEVASSEHTEVTVRAAALEGATQLASAARAVDSGNFSQAEVLLDSSIEVLKVQAARIPTEELNTQIAEMEQAKTEIKTAKSSVSAQKYYVKKAKSSAYTKSKAASSAPPVRKTSSKKHRVVTEFEQGSY